MIKNLPTRLLIVFCCAFILLVIFLLSPKNKIAENVVGVRTSLLANSKQKTVSEFEHERNDYSYVSFDNLYSDTSLYYGTKVYQIGHVKTLDSDNKYLLVALDGNDKSRTIKLKYDLASFARGDISLQENDSIKFYGRVMATDKYVNEKGRDITRPVISADFIQTKNHEQGENNGII